MQSPVRPEPEQDKMPQQRQWPENNQTPFLMSSMSTCASAFMQFAGSSTGQLPEYPGRVSQSAGLVDFRWNLVALHFGQGGICPVFLKCSSSPHSVHCKTPGAVISPVR